MTGKDGKIAARVTAARASVDEPPGAGAVAVVGSGTATLYEEGEPTASLSAEKITADQTTRTITGEGNVVATSLVHKGSPTIRADTMTWDPDQSQIRGEGNVRITRDPDLHMPGREFTADTKIQRFRVVGDGLPITGQY